MNPTFGFLVILFFIAGATLIIQCEIQEAKDEILNEIKKNQKDKHESR